MRANAVRLANASGSGYIPPLDDAVRAALDRQRAGDVVSAAAMYEELLRAAPASSELSYLLGVAQHQLGRYAEAEVSFRRAIGRDSSDIRFHIGLGRNFKELGNYSEAIACYRAALDLDADCLDALTSLGIALSRSGQPEVAAGVLRRALELNPLSAEILVNLANALFYAERHEDAISEYRKALALNPGAAEARNNLGRALSILARRQEAIDELESAIKLQPRYPEALCNLADLNALDGRRERACQLYVQAIDADPAYTAAYLPLVRLLYEAGQLSDALKVLDLLTQREPEELASLLLRGLVLREQGDLTGALTWFDRVLSRDPGNLDGLLAAGSTHWAMGDRARTIEAASLVLNRQPDQPGALSLRGNAELLAGRVEAALSWYGRGTQAAQAFSELWHNQLLVSNYLDSLDAPHLLEIHRAWGALVSERGSQAGRHFAEPGKDRRVRIGFVSPDFNQHSVAHFIEPVLVHMDRRRFRVYCYYSSPRVDRVTVRLSDTGVEWRAVCGLPAERVAEMIREDRIDVLIDLAGHTAGNRLDVFARRAAPVQATYLGYPTTTGLAAMDYRITDSVIDPELGEAVCTEIPLRLPGSSFCYRPPESTPAVSELPARNTGIFTFGSFNNLAKLSATAVRLWALVLRECAGSVLFLKHRSLSSAEIQREVTERFVAEGVDAARIRYASWQGETSAHLALYQEVDVALDTVPYNGATTTCEALWMGVPVVSLMGGTHAGRMGASLLRAAGLEEFVATDESAFVHLCKSWSSNLEGLARLRSGLRTRLRASALMDEVSFVRRFEKLLETAST